MKFLLKTLLVLSSLVAIALAQAPEAPQAVKSPFQVGEIKATEVSPGVVEVKLTATTLRAVPLVETVPVPTARLLLAGIIRVGAFIEADLLGSFMPVDINGDGRLNQVEVRETSKGLRIGGVKIETMSNGGPEQRPFRSNGKMKRYTLDPDAPDFAILSYVKPYMTMLLSHRTELPEVLELPNPHLQVVVFEHSEPVNGPVFLPQPPTFDMTIDGKRPDKKYLLYAWEPALFKSLNLSPRWLKAHWFIIPLDSKPGVAEHTLEVRVARTTPAVGLYTQVNYATEKGVQVRTDRSVGVIWSRPKEENSSD